MDGIVQEAQSRSNQMLTYVCQKSILRKMTLAFSPQIPSHLEPRDLDASETACLSTLEPASATISRCWRRGCPVYLLLGMTTVARFTKKYVHQAFNLVKSMLIQSFVKSIRWFFS